MIPIVLQINHCKRLFKLYLEYQLLARSERVNLIWTVVVFY